MQVKETRVKEERNYVKTLSVDLNSTGSNCNMVIEVDVYNLGTHLSLFGKTKISNKVAGLESSISPLVDFETLTKAFTSLQAAFEAERQRDKDEFMLYAENA